MAKRIAMFNHKGGVSRTTTTFNLGWQLASMGKRVILADADPQANLTGLVLGYKGASDLDRFYEQEATRNLKSGLAPAFESRPVPIEAVDCFPVENRDGLFLLPGHIELAEYEVTLGIAHGMSGSIQALQNLPGSISCLLSRTAAKLEADYVLIDMNPSLSSFNQNLLATSEYFIVPTAPDHYSAMAIVSLAKVLPSWDAWSRQAQASLMLRNAIYPFPKVRARFLGTVIQNHRPGKDEPATGFRKWFDDINKKTNDTLFPALEKVGMVLSADKYESVGMSSYCLATVPDFSSLIAKSQEHRTPMHALNDRQLDRAEVALETAKKSHAEFREIFDDMASKVICLTSDA